MAKIFPTEEKTDQTNKAGRGGKLTAGAQFKNQLISLVTTLGSTSPHYVRCIKPNQEKEAFYFSDEMVLSQLRYSGMLDTIRIRKAGYPMRLAFDAFVRDFKCLIPSGLTYKKDDAKKISAAIAAEAKLPGDAWQAGKSKLFLKDEALAALQDRAAEILRGKVILIQKTLLGYLYRQRYLRMRNAVRFLETYLIGFLSKRRYRRILRATLKIQAAARGWFARRYYKGMLAEKRAAEQKAAEREQEAERKAAAKSPEGRGEDTLMLSQPGHRRASIIASTALPPSRAQGDEVRLHAARSAIVRAYQFTAGIFIGSLLALRKLCIRRR